MCGDVAGSMEWVDQFDAAALEVGGVAGGEGEFVEQGGGGDEPIMLVSMSAGMAQSSSFKGVLADGRMASRGGGANSPSSENSKGWRRSSVSATVSLR